MRLSLLLLPLAAASAIGASSTSKPSSSSSSSLSHSTSTKPKTSLTPSKTSNKASSTTLQYASQVPNIDVCGTGSGAGNVSCPGAGSNGYFYRCCSGPGHCGPKNSLQAQSLYCGDGCQPGFGLCGGETMQPPPNPTGTPGIAQNGDTCGPIVNMRCDTGLCCSGSNYCGTGTDFCGSANWCQAEFGECDDSS